MDVTSNHRFGRKGIRWCGESLCVGKLLEAEALAEALSGIGAKVIYLFDGVLIDVTVQTCASRKTCEHFMRAKGLVIEKCELVCLTAGERVFRIKLDGLDVCVSGREFGGNG